MTILDSNIITQVRELFSTLTSHYQFRIRAGKHKQAAEMIAFMNELADCSDLLSCELIETSEQILEFCIIKEGEETGIIFRGIPNGHEFSSLLLAILNADGKGKNLPDEGIIRRIRSLKGEIHLQSYISLTCTNCPDIVQALNIVTLFNPQVTHEIIDGALFPQEIDQLKIQAVPTVYANNTLLHIGRGSLGELLDKLELQFGVTNSITQDSLPKSYDLIVAGGGPAGISAAIYSARKGLKVAIVADRIGGQVKETVGIENLISVPHTTGNHLANDLRTHMEQYPIAVFENRRIEKIQLKEKVKQLEVIGGEYFEAPALIVATGASWRKLNVPGESEYIGRGVAFCPHCDGPLFHNKRVAVIGGGNSGIEAAIDLAGICSKVTVLEFADTLKADRILIDKANALPNVEIFTNMQTKEIIGNGETVTALRAINRSSQAEQQIELDGIFVQIGLAANTQPFKHLLKTTQIGEIIIDEFCRTNQAGIYAAGDVSNVPYKQIIIAMGEGAKAALSAFDDRIRGLLGA